jgi:Tfp pilus assembly protein PilO
MSRSKRKALIRAVERIAVAIAVLDVAAYAVLILGLGNRISAAQQLREDLLRHVRDEGKRIVRLEKFKSSLPDAENQLAQFEQKHVPTRRKGFSRAAQLVREVAQQSGVEVTDVGYKLDSEKNQPLERLAITVSVEGPFTNLVRFAHALETADDFIVERGFKFEPREGGNLALHLSSDLYLLP